MSKEITTLFDAETNIFLHAAADAVQSQKDKVTGLYWKLHNKIAEVPYSNRGKQEIDLVRLGRLAHAMKLMAEAKNMLSDVTASHI